MAGLEADLAAFEAELAQLEAADPEIAAELAKVEAEDRASSEKQKQQKEEKKKEKTALAIDLKTAVVGGSSSAVISGDAQSVKVRHDADKSYVISTTEPSPSGSSGGPSNVQAPVARPLPSVSGIGPGMPPNIGPSGPPGSDTSRLPPALAAQMGISALASSTVKQDPYNRVIAADRFMTQRLQRQSGPAGLSQGSASTDSLKKRKEIQENALLSKTLREAGGQAWVDKTLADWPSNDHRIFVGDLGNEVGDAVLAEAFAKYKSFAKARVVRNALTGKSRGYGFVSFLDPNDFVKAMREMNGAYIGNRPCKLRKSNWQKRSAGMGSSKQKKRALKHAAMAKRTKVHERRYMLPQ
ncbi:MAG: hypothetical protein MHM6MM_004400 [Cercozoa sp. M6MM]